MLSLMREGRGRRPTKGRTFDLMAFVGPVDLGGREENLKAFGGRVIGPNVLNSSSPPADGFVGVDCSTEIRRNVGGMKERRVHE